MKMQRMIEILEALAPISCAESWDNVGLLVGTREKAVQRVMVALDASDEVIEQAIEQRVDALITHHPMIFSAMKRVTDEDFIGRRIIKLLQNDISYYAMHTNCDVCVMNNVAAEKIGLQGEEVLEVVTVSEAGESLGIGKVGTLSAEKSVRELARVVKEVFSAENVRMTGSPDKKVSRVAISTGAGKSMVKHALAKSAQVLITGDIDHHTAIDAIAQGLQIIDAGHYGTEHFMAQLIKEYLQEQCKDELVVIEAKENDPFLSIS